MNLSAVLGRNPDVKVIVRLLKLTCKVTRAIQID